MQGRGRDTDLLPVRSLASVPVATGPAVTKHHRPLHLAAWNTDKHTWRREHPLQCRMTLKHPPSTFGPTVRASSRAVR